MRSGSVQAGPRQTESPCSRQAAAPEAVQRRGTAPALAVTPSTQVTSVAFAPDGSRLLTTSWDGTLGIWDPTTGVETKSLKVEALRQWRPSFTAFSRDSRRVLVHLGGARAPALWR